MRLLRRHGLLLLALLVLLLALLLAGCTADRGVAAREPGSATHPTAPSPWWNGSTDGRLWTPKDPYVALGTMLHRRGVQVWYETDLVAAWLAGPAHFRATVARLHDLARVPGVVGFKIADEIGYGDGLKTPAQALAFLHAAGTAVHKAAPGKQILIDAVIPAIGCLPWRGTAEQGCAASADAHYPAATIAAMTSYLHTGVLDRVDLSTGLLDPATYAGWGVSTEQAQQEAWARVTKWGWDRLTTLQARKALADVGGYQGDGTQAAQDARVFVATPTAAGARAVDVWTWRQPYDGSTVSLLGPGLTANPLWTDLLAQRRDGIRLFTHMTPSAMPRQADAVAAECDRAAQLFDAVFVAAGTG
ncbi:MAG: hypothetical protein ACXVXH_11665 [Nocardioidaceae bacterium]